MLLSRRLLRAASGGGGSGITSPTHPDLIAMYTMDNISGTTLVDESSNNFDSNILGATTAAGILNDALSYPGSQDRTESINSLPSLSEFTISFWMNQIDGSGLNIVLETSLNSNANTGAWFVGTSAITQDDIVFVFRKVGNGDSIGAVTDSALIDGSFHHVVCAYNSSGGTVADQLKLYVDGVLQSTYSGPSNTSQVSASSHKLYTGLRKESVVQYQFPYSRDLDQLRIFSRVLTPSEIAELYNGGAGA